MKTLARGADLAEIRMRIAALTVTDAAVWGKMSVAEMVCHLREAFLIGIGAKASTPVKYPVPPAMVKFLALKMPTEWKHGVPTVPELLPGAVTPPAEFEADRAGLVRALDRFVEMTENRTSHAIFGAMEPADWMRWGYLHADHHLRQFGR